MAVIDTGLTVAGLRSEFFDRFDQVPTVWQDLATQYASTKDVEHHKWLGTVPQMREWGTGRLAKGLRTESYDVANLKYESTIEVDRDEISDDQTGQIRIRVNELARRAALHKDQMIADLLKNGTAAGFLSYDGQTFFSDSHVSGASGTQDNNLSLTIADTDKNAFTSAEGKAALQNAITQMLAFKDDQGEPMDLQPSGLTIVCPPGQFYRWLEIVNASVINNTSNILSGVARVVQFPRLTTAGEWFLLKTDEYIRPFLVQDREPIEFGQIAEGSEQDFLREKWLFGVRARYRVAYGEWRFGVRTVLA